MNISSMSIYNKNDMISQVFGAKRLIENELNPDRLRFEFGATPAGMMCLIKVKKCETWHQYRIHIPSECVGSNTWSWHGIIHDAINSLRKCIRNEEEASCPS